MGGIHLIGGSSPRAVPWRALQARLSEGESVGEDLLVKDGVLYALANRRLAPDRHII